MYKLVFVYQSLLLLPFLLHLYPPRWQALIVLRYFILKAAQLIFKEWLNYYSMNFELNPFQFQSVDLSHNFVNFLLKPKSQ